MIKIGTIVVNENQIAFVEINDKGTGSTIHVSMQQYGIVRDIEGVFPKDIYAAIEKRDGEMNRIKKENDRLQKELKETEDLYIRSNNENEALRARLGEILPSEKWRSKECPGYVSGEYGCAGIRIPAAKEEEDFRLHTYCVGCEQCDQFCDPAAADDEGCEGRRRRDGSFYDRCKECIGLKAEE